MWLKINVHNLKDGVRICKAEDDTVTNREPDFIFYASDSEVTGMMPISILRRSSGKISSNSIEKAYWREMEPHYDDGWRTDMILWVYEEKKFETIPYAVSHSAYDGIYDGRYRLTENKTLVEDNECKDDFSFCAFPVDPSSLIHISVGIYPRYDTTRIVYGLTAKDDMYKHDFTFKGLSHPHPGTIPISVGRTGETEDRRHRVSEGTNAGDLGWTHDFVFYAFEREKPGTIPIAVGHAAFRGGWKYRVSQDTFAGDKGWTNDFVFHVYPVDTSSVFPVAVGFESGHKCARLNEGERLDELYFQHDFSFYAFKNGCPETIPIAVGEAGAEFNHTLRSILVRGTNAGDKGWSHKFLFYAYSSPKEGTIPVAIGHSDFDLGGWKYRVCENSENAGNNEWTHDFVFHVFPSFN